MLYRFRASLLQELGLLADVKGITGNNTLKYIFYDVKITCESENCESEKKEGGEKKF